MFLEIIVSLSLGIVFGTLTGLIPGIHPNTVFMMIVSGALALTGTFPATCLMIFIISVAVSNTFTDFLPSVIFGAPDPSTALSVLPGHRMLLQGRGHEAITLTVIGGLGVALITILTIPLLVHAIPAAYFTLRPHLHTILLALIVWMILTEKGWGRLSAMAVLSLSGALGFVTLNMFPSGSLLFPSLTGMFAFGTLVTSYQMRTVLPEQEAMDEIQGDHRPGILSGWLAGWLAGMLPGIGASQAGVVAAQAFRNKESEFMTALGGINTSNILFTLVMLFVIGKTRSGATFAISQFSGPISPWEFALLAFSGLTVCFISGAVTLKLSRTVLDRLAGIDYGRVTVAVMAFLIVMVAVLSGLPGLVAAATGLFIGLLSITTGVKRSHMMGYLLIPTILFFSGLSVPVMLTLGV